MKCDKNWIGLLGGFVLLGAAGCAGGGDEVDPMDLPAIEGVVGGSVVYQGDEDWNAVRRSTARLCGSWASTGTGGCGTGILIGPRVLLTVGHNFGNENTRSEDPINNTASFLSADGLLQSVDIDIGKEEDLESGEDLGILVLETPPNVAIPYWHPSDQITDDMWLIGYGSGDDGDATLEKATGCTLSGSLYTNSGDKTKMGAMDCELGGGEGGDSGSPVFNENDEIVGLHKSSNWHSSEFVYLGDADSSYRKFIEAKLEEYRAKLIVANYDGEGGADFLFWNNKGKGSWVDLSGTTGLDYAADDTLGGWCDADLRTGDFNGDGKTDLLCYRASDKRIWIDYSNNGKFNGTDMTMVFDWCDREILVGDYNGDGYDDLYCRDADSWRRVDLNSQNPSRPFSESDWETQSGWCGSTGYHFVGDFNGDGRDDLLCYVPDSAMYIKYATADGTFAAAHKSRTTNWCGTVGTLYVGNFDGDKVDDLFCWNSKDNKMYIDYGVATSAGFPFGGTNWQNLNTKWCWEAVAELSIGDVNGDGKDDLVCSRWDTGQTYADFAEEKYATFNGINDKILPSI
jgi:hypothetical protein